ncbi:MAG: hypothetical protein L0Y54_17235 [Sporichthyaceae bacterium]|nr:hypothetical protein [Sporichthyaceae bacterium]
MASGGAALSAVLGTSATAGDPRSQAAPETLTCRVPPDVLLDQLLEAVDELVPYALELRAVRRRLWGWQNPVSGAPAPSARTIANRQRGIELAWTLTVALRPTLRQLYDLAKPGQYLPPFELRLRSLLWRARQAYCTAIEEALNAARVNVLDYWLNEGGRLVGEFRAKLQDLYLYDPKGLEGQIRAMAETAVDLIQLRTERGSGAFPNRAADAELLLTTTPAGGPWPRLAPLLNELQGIRDYEFADQAEKYLRFSQKLQGLALGLNVLATRERLSWLADQTILPSSAAGRLDGYAAALGNALTQIEIGIAQFKLGNFVAAADAQKLGVAALNAVTGPDAFKNDIKDVTDTIELQEQVKAVAAGVAIAAASALTAGAVGAAAGVALAAVVDTSTVVGVLVVSAGVLATEVLWETIVARAGSEILLGPQSIQGSGFLDDLGWQAAQTVALRLTMYGAGDIFKAVAKAGKRAEAIAKIAVQQISMFAFGEVQFVIRTGRLHTLREAVFAGVQQIASTGVIMAGGLLGETFANRLGAARGSIGDAGEQRLAVLEAERAQVLTDFDAIRNGTASDAQFVAWARRAAEVWNGLVALVQDMPAGADRLLALGKLSVAKGEIELRLAELGISATLTLPDAVPMFQGLLPGLVAVSDDGRPVLDTAYPPASRLPSSDPDAVLALGSGGRRVLFLPAGDLPAQAPPPQRLAHVPEATARPGAPDQPVVLPGAPTVGLQRLQAAMGAAKVTRMLAQAPPGQAEAFLRLIAHPDLAAVGAVQTRANALAGLASHPPSLAFGRRWGPLLVLRMRRRLGVGPGLDDGLARADNLLSQTPAADRSALIARLMGLDSGELRRELGQTPPLRPPRRRITPDNLGIDDDHPQWTTLRQEVERDFAALTLVQKVALTDCLQVIEVAASGAFDGYQAQTKLAVLEAFELRMVQGQIRGQLSAIVANGLRGRLAEHLFLGQLPVLQQTMWLGGGRIYDWLGGRSNMDAYWLVGQLAAFGELKSDDIHLQTASQQEATARGYRTDAIGDFENISPGSTYYLWFIRDPGLAGQQRMRTILLAPASPITGVYFGPATPPTFPRR